MVGHSTFISEEDIILPKGKTIEILDSTSEIVNTIQFDYFIFKPVKIPNQKYFAAANNLSN